MCLCNRKAKLQQYASECKHYILDFKNDESLTTFLMSSDKYLRYHNKTITRVFPLCSSSSAFIGKERHGMQYLWDTSAILNYQ